MKIWQMNKIMAIRTLSVGITAVMMTGCVSTKYLSEGITDAGHVPAENIVFPELDEAWIKEGRFPNSENLSLIRAGIDKFELHPLIGTPHFNEAQYAREWDYIFNFYMPDESVKVCQFKVIFDKNFTAQEFYWHPKNCAPTKIEELSSPVVSIKNTINLNTDALFNFDKWQIDEMLPQGRTQLNELAKKLIDYRQMQESHIDITGHTDYLGDNLYNLNLSQLRAQTVRQYLIQRGVDPHNMIATGAGESQPIKQCPQNQSRTQLIDCLQPNRRVEINVMVVQ